MTETDRRLIEQILEKHTVAVSGQYLLIKQELEYIKEQVTRTNGRVTRHDETLTSLQLESREHFIKCPQADRIDLLEQSETSRKSIYKFVVWVGSVVGAVSVIVIALLEYIKKD
jgi:hypothetical protein